jgi:hypothetical protein
MALTVLAASAIVMAAFCSAAMWLVDREPTRRQAPLPAFQVAADVCKATIDIFPSAGQPPASFYLGADWDHIRRGLLA